MDNLTDYRIQIPFKVTDTDGTVFADAIYMTPSEFAGTTAEALSQIKLDRFNNWKAQVEIIKNAPQPDPIEEIIKLEQEIEQLAERKQNVITTITETTSKSLEQVEQEIEVKRVEIAQEVEADNSSIQTPEPDTTPENVSEPTPPIAQSEA